MLTWTGRTSESFDAARDVMIGFAERSFCFEFLERGSSRDLATCQVEACFQKVSRK